MSLFYLGHDKKLKGVLMSSENSDLKKKVCKCLISSKKSDMEILNLFDLTVMIQSIVTLERTRRIRYVDTSK